MTTFNCGCHIISDVIDLNNSEFNNKYLGYLLKTYINMCGRCGKKQMKFQYMENKLMEMEKRRVKMFFEENDEDEDTFFDLMELKEHLRTLAPRERHKVKDFERLETSPMD